MYIVYDSCVLMAFPLFHLHASPKEYGLYHQGVDDNARGCLIDVQSLEKSRLLGCEPEEGFLSLCQF